MKKHIKSLLSIFVALLAALCLVAVTCLVGCGDKVLARPPEMAADYEGSGKALECWVAERPGGVVLGDWHYIPGTMGGKRYAGSEYDDRPTGEEYDLPASRGRVVYTLTAYPDYSSGDSDTVTRIEITDPAVTVYGISCNSAIQDFVAVFGGLGCQTEQTERSATATYGKTRLRLTAVDGERSLSISVEVTNKDGIVF